MTTQEYTARIDRIFRDNRPEDICRYLQARALSGSFLGYVMLDHFGRTHTTDARNIVQEVFFTPADEREFFRSRLDWQRIDSDLKQLVTYAQRLYDEGDLRQAAAIATNIISITYREYRDDHSSQDTPNLRRDYHNGKALTLLRHILIESRPGGASAPLSYEERRSIVIAFREEMRSFVPKDRFCALTKFFADARFLLTAPQAHDRLLRPGISTKEEMAGTSPLAQLVHHHISRAVKLPPKRIAAKAAKILELINRPLDGESARIELQAVMAELYAVIPDYRKYVTICAQPYDAWRSRANEGVRIRIAEAADEIRAILAEGDTHMAVIRYLLFLRALVAGYPPAIPEGTTPKNAPSTPKETTAAVNAVLFDDTAGQPRRGPKPRKEIINPDVTLQNLHATLLAAPLTIGDQLLLEAGHEAIRKTTNYRKYNYPAYII